MIPKPSEEQQKIIDTIQQGENVIVDAVAGSGKTTTILGIAKAIPSKRVWQITFNAQLKCEVRNKAQEAEIDNLKVHTYHSLATHLYDRTAHTDARIIAILNEDKPMLHQKEVTNQVDILIVDEAQDMTLLYFRLIEKFVKYFNNPNLKMAIFGDRYQGVYEFMKADTRFLTLAENVWHRMGTFKHLTLKESYRLTASTAWFINHCMVKENRIVARKPGPKVEWYIGDMFKLHKLFLNQLIKDIKDKVVKPEDIFILSASLKGAKTPVKAIENMFVDKKIPVYVPISDECRLDDDVTRGKVVFATFPSSKGRERPIVIIMGFDENYFNFFAKESPRDVCPPCLYVALSRPSQRLILVGSKQSAPLPFMSWSQLDFKANVSLVNDDILMKRTIAMTRAYDKTTSPTELIRFLKQETIEHLEPIVARLFKTTLDPSYEVKIPSKVSTTSNTAGTMLYEDVADLNGLAIPAIWEQKRTGSTTIYDRITLMCQQSSQSSSSKMIKKIPKEIKTVSDFLYASNMYLALTEGYHGRLAQITSYDWLTKPMVNKCIKTLDLHVKGTVSFEVAVDATVQTPFGAVLMRGFIDVIDDASVWEIKCVDHLQLEHRLQLISYYYMFHRTTKLVSEQKKQFHLLNVRTGELLHLIPDENDIDRVMSCLFAHKYQPTTRLCDEDFILQISNLNKKSGEREKEKGEEKEENEKNKEELENTKDDSSSTLQQMNNVTPI